MTELRGATMETGERRLEDRVERCQTDRQTDRLQTRGGYGLQA